MRSSALYGITARRGASDGLEACWRKNLGHLPRDRKGGGHLLGHEKGLAHRKGFGHRRSPGIVVRQGFMLQGGAGEERPWEQVERETRGIAQRGKEMRL